MKTRVSFKKTFKFLASLILVLTFSAVRAQEQKTSLESSISSKFGVKGGVNFTNPHSNDFADAHLKVGFNAGFYAKIPIVTGVSIQPELLYSLKGSKLDYNNILQGTGEYRFNLWICGTACASRV